jgi:hypothetical protein
VAELLDAGGRPIPGYSYETCNALRGDDVRHTVTWGGEATLDRLRGASVKVRFRLQHAALYAYSL